MPQKSFYRLIAGTADDINRQLTALNPQERPILVTTSPPNALTRGEANVYVVLEKIVEA